MTRYSVDELLERMRVKYVYGFEELTGSEQEILSWAIDLVRACTTLTNRFDVEIVDFFHNDTGGCFWHHPGPNLVRIARKQLQCRMKTIIVIVHETCHAFGPDGSLEHENACQQLFGQIIAHQAELLDECTI